MDERRIPRAGERVRTRVGAMDQSLVTSSSTMGLDFYKPLLGKGSAGLVEGGSGGGVAGHNAEELVDGCKAL